MAELKDKYLPVLRLAKTLGSKKMKTAEENGQLVVNGNCPTQYLLDVVLARAKEIDAEHKDLALNLKAEVSSELTTKYGSVYEQAYTLDCEEVVLKEENGVLTITANCPTQYNADRVTEKAKKADAEWQKTLTLDLKVQRTDIYGEYKTKADDTLETVAKKVTKNKVTPEQILEANKDVLTDPKVLPAKTMLKIPNWDASAVKEEKTKSKKSGDEAKPAKEAKEAKPTPTPEPTPSPVVETKPAPAAEAAPAPAVTLALSAASLTLSAAILAKSTAILAASAAALAASLSALAVLAAITALAAATETALAVDGKG